MEINVTNGQMSEQEIKNYIHYIESKFPQEEISTLTIHVDGDEVDLDYILQPKKFERIRRITGYLVGTVDRFNDAKAAEESQRVKHI